MNTIWNQLYSDTQKLTKAASAHHVFSQDDIAFIEQRLKRILHAFLSQEELHQGIKVYVDQQLNNKVVRQMASQKPTEDESLEEWCSSIFQEKKFGVVFNSLESYDNQLVERMCDIIQPLLQKAGMPLGGLSFLFFMGNYGFTPFGIHKEAKGEEGFLFHMGPSNKTFYTWDIDEYNQIDHNTEVFHNVEEMLPMAEPYELSPQSVMFVPNDLYHIANTEEFSFSVVMDYINPSREALETMIAKKITEEINDSPKNKEYLAPVNTSESLDWNQLFNTTTWEAKYKQALERYISRLKSNSGVLLPVIPDRSNYFTSENFSIEGKSVFTLLQFEDQNGQRYIMTRGREIPTKRNKNLGQVLKDLNTGKTFTFEALKNILLTEWELPDLYEFVSQLLEFDAVKKIDH